MSIIMNPVEDFKIAVFKDALKYLYFYEVLRVSHLRTNNHPFLIQVQK